MATTEQHTLQKIVQAFPLDKPEAYRITPFGSGLIHRTWKLAGKTEEDAFILQQVNHAVFQNPWDIAYNIRSIETYLRKHHPDYLFIVPVKTRDGKDLFYEEESGYFRLFPFLRHSHTLDAVSTPAQAYEAARQFGLFTRVLSGFNASSLKTTLPHFHDLSLRYRQFEEAVQNGNRERIKTAGALIQSGQEQKSLVATYEQIRHDPSFKLRVTHHDTKISNVLLDQADRGLCVIDLDTVMPGYFISDVGDMMRTYLSAANEEEADVSKVDIREDIFEAIVTGYFDVMKDELSQAEKEHFIYAGKFMMYMQALRFLTDFLNNDRYYGARYEHHNLKRAENQFALLQRLLEKEEALTRLVQAAS